jgi:hypothetical protein
VELPQAPLDAETVAVIIRVTGGNFRLLNGLLTQIQRILEINTMAKLPWKIAWSISVAHAGSA